ncbi:hypothetical protein [Microbacterium galbinum]|uniref:Uncharacterized protein n=1 Tax=Microbacterium galbinum TaxID=2851646 RepID=A0ABY4IP16_9MICO|nr:hypothetical protein [Microbacterium galbinum]UPL13033.1 hypothetical protein KV396_00350 [Microbacterium galbinum]
MATTHRSDLVEQLEKALTDEAYDGGNGALSEEQFAKLVRTLATTAAAVVTEVHTPTDDEREALATILGEPVRGTLALADRILAAGFRRSEVETVAEALADAAEPQGEPSDAEAAWEKFRGALAYYLDGHAIESIRHDLRAAGGVR